MVCQILVSCETPIQWEQFSLVYIANACCIWYFIQFVRITIFMSLHGPAITFIPVASESPILVLPIQVYFVTYIIYKIYIIIHTHDPKLF